jgi:PLP dependent protein
MGLQENLDFYTKIVASHQAKLIAVSKTHPVESILAAYHLGQKVFGENRVQELVEKYELLPKDIEWHLIGHLQKNKVKYIVGFVALIHSIDTWELLLEVDKQAGKIGRCVSCLLQVHIADEETKFGFSEDELIDLLNNNDIGNLQHVNIVGLMGMATFSKDLNKIAAEFNRLKKIFDRIKTQFKVANVHMEELSMGMSSDYKLALTEGSTMIRVGTAIFGKR